jgi:lysophospholipid acyltransferase (LPLAT)-like uncharacterized protein
MRARHPWWLPLAAGLGAVFVRALGATWRYTVSDAPEYSAALARGERFVYAFWHSGLLPGAVLHRDEGIAVLVSRHRDGELITRVIEHLGYVTARGSSTRGGEAGVRGMLTWAAQGRQLAVTPDGPRGPAEQVKPGALYLAERTGRRMVPIGFAAHPVYALRSWDRFRIPWPFARVLVSHGAPFEPAAWPAAQAAGTPGAAAAAQAAGIPGAAAAAQATGIPGAAPAAQAAGVPGASDVAECARLAFERALAAVARDVRTRVGERL